MFSRVILGRLLAGLLKQKELGAGAARTAWSPSLLFGLNIQANTVWLCFAAEK